MAYSTANSGIITSLNN